MTASYLNPRPNASEGAKAISYKFNLLFVFRRSIQLSYGFLAACARRKPIFPARLENFGMNISRDSGSSRDSSALTAEAGEKQGVAEMRIAGGGAWIGRIRG